MTDRSAPAPTHGTSVRQRIVHGLGANAFGQLVTIIVQLVGVPILLHAWGVQLYGEWLILFAIPAYLSMTDLGFSQSAGNDMTARVARGDRAGALAVFQSLGILVSSVTAVGMLLTVALLWWLPLDRWLHFQVLDADASRWVLGLLAAQVFVSLMNGVNHAGFRANGDYALHTSLNATARLVQFGSVWTIALAGGGPVLAAAGFLAVQAVFTAACAVILSRRHRWLRFGIASARRAELEPLWRPALANVVIPLAQALNVQGMVLVVGALLGPVAVVVFSTLRTLARLALQAVLAVSHAIQPELEGARGLRDQSLLESLYIKGLGTTLVLSLAVGLLLAFSGPWIVTVWTNGQVNIDYGLFYLLLVSSICSVFWYGALGLLKALQRHLSSTLFYALCSLGAIVLAAASMKMTGMVVFAGVALVLEEVFMAIFVLSRTTREIGLSATRIIYGALGVLPQLARTVLSMSSKRLHRNSHLEKKSTAK